MSINRNTILRGPGTVKFGGVTVFDSNGITCEIESATQGLPSSISGEIGTIKTDQTGKISFTPCGQISAAILAALFPYASAAIGSSACGADDTPCVVHGMSGTRVTLVNCCVRKMPEIYLSPVKTAFGSVELAAALGLAKGPTDDAALYTVEQAAYDAGAPDPTGITGVAYAGTFGALSIPDTADGWTITPEVTLNPVSTDTLGTIDWTVASVGCTAKCTPLGLTEEQILAALPATRARGSLIGGDDLVVTGAGGLKVTLHGASLVTGQLQWGNTQLRAGEIGFTAHRSFAGGVPGPVFEVELA
nr:MAG TPA: hypothetical protein [Caudoviricetes sp.]